MRSETVMKAESGLNERAKFQQISLDSSQYFTRPLEGWLSLRDIQENWAELCPSGMITTSWEALKNGLEISLLIHCSSSAPFSLWELPHKGGQETHQPPAIRIPVSLPYCFNLISSQHSVVHCLVFVCWGFFFFPQSGSGCCYAGMNAFWKPDTFVSTPTHAALGINRKN